MGKYEDRRAGEGKRFSFAAVPLSFFLIEVFGFCFLRGDAGMEGQALWPLAFGGVWAILLACLIRALPQKGGRIMYGLLYFPALIYAGFQTGYYHLFGEMMWISEFLYAAEGSDYANVLLSYPLLWYISILLLVGLGTGIVWKFPVWEFRGISSGGAGLAAMVCALAALWMPQLTFLNDGGIRYAGSDYGRMQASEAAYNNMFNTHRLYEICGLYQTAAKDVWKNAIYPLTPHHAMEHKKSVEKIDAFFDEKSVTGNDMTGILRDKNVILVLMESMDDWMIGEHTPTIRRLMEEGITFTNFYTPPYGGIRTFNTEFCINTGSFLSSRGGYAFDYVTNTYRQSLAAQLRQEGYSALTFHYNDPSFYSRGVFSEAMGYENYVCYGDYLKDLEEKAAEQLLYDDLLLFQEPELRETFFREGKRLNFVITRSAHLSYKYNEVLSYWGLKRYPAYRGLTGNEETDCAYLKAKLVDDFFARMLLELEAEGELEKTVIIGVTDHYTYGYKNMASLLELSGVETELLLEKTPCFIWSPGLEPQKMDKFLNTADLLPTVLNLLGVRSEYAYIGSDAFDPDYRGFVPFSDGSWISDGIVYDTNEDRVYSLSGGEATASEEFFSQMEEAGLKFTEINNLILETDYYKGK